MNRRVLLQVAIALILGATSGYALALAFPETQGRPHGCPAGSGQCAFPAEQAGHRVTWTLLGGVAGLMLSTLVVLRPKAGHELDRAEQQKHPDVIGGPDHP